MTTLVRDTVIQCKELCVGFRQRKLSLGSGIEEGSRDFMEGSVVLSAVEQARLRLSQGTSATKKSQLGQYFTPATTAQFMAGLFPRASGDCRLLDAGAGIGSLTAAFLERWRRGEQDFKRVHADAFEIDLTLHEPSASTLGFYQGRDLTTTIRPDDFIAFASSVIRGGLFEGRRPSYTHAILNPPYKKISVDSAYRLALRSAGIETVNLYAAFVALALELLEPGGHIVAIVPRSFCNGPYYRAFREYILARGALRQLHLFGSRSKAFKDDAVLQENIIVAIERSGRQGPVVVSTSTDDSFIDLEAHTHDFARIVPMGDPHRFIHVPTASGEATPAGIVGAEYTLRELGLEVSTGPVVDFRLRDHLRAMPEVGSVPLLYATHFRSGVVWPIAGSKKPNAVRVNAETERWLYPVGHYCVVRRFSAKEERRRLVASVVEPKVFEGYTQLGFENHLNVFHAAKRGLPAALARGLAVYLNSQAVDDYFRLFNGHTQVNATDLRAIKYPSRDTLIALGNSATESESDATQTALERSA